MQTVNTTISELDLEIVQILLACLVVGTLSLGCILYQVKMVQVKDCAVIRDIKPMMAMILCQLASGGVNIFYKLAVHGGMKVKILVFYRLLVASIFIAPLALFIERKSRPKLTWNIFFQGLACGFLGGAVGSNLYAESLVLTSATLATSMTNIIPALTLLMAVSLKLERIELMKSTGRAKVIGTALTICGAMILTLYNGTPITLWSTQTNLLHATKPQVKHNHFLGCFLALCSCICYAGWLIIQTKMSQTYPPYSSSALYCVSGTIMSGVYALFRETTWSEWKLGLNIRLLSAAYMGIIGSGMATVLTAWGTRVRGPLYVSAFAPLGLIFVTLLGSLILDEQLNLGSIIGSVIIILGLYSVLWGKSKEMQMSKSAGESQTDNSVVVPRNANLNNENKSSDAIQQV